MSTRQPEKKRIVINYNNLSDELLEKVKDKYPNGYAESMLRIDRGPGDFFYGIVLETEDTNYLIKINVTIDDGLEEEDDKEYYNDEIKGVDDLTDTPDEESDEE